VKTIEKNISRHENGYLYLVARRKGKLTVTSLKTKDLVEARRKIREMGIQALTTTAAPLPPPSPEFLPAPSPAPPPVLAAVAEMQPPAPAMSLAEALAAHDRGVIVLSQGTQEMLERGNRAISRFSTGWDDFDPVGIWKQYRATGLARQGCELGSAANHLRWYFRKFIPWAVKRGWLGEGMLASLKEIPRLKVNPRRIRVPSKKIVGEFLAMIESEDPDGGAFVRLLATSGLRRGGALALRWDNVDFDASQIVVRQKGGTDKVFPMTPEAQAVLEGRVGKPKPFKLDINAIERLERKIKRFAKGFGIDLKTYHSFRHYFASRCLMDGLTVQEVAKLLGHSDGGVLVLKTYGHICGEHLKNAVSRLRLTED
jgi:site-specific recombinase XerD